MALAGQLQGDRREVCEAPLPSPSGRGDRTGKDEGQGRAYCRHSMWPGIGVAIPLFVRK